MTAVGTELEQKSLEMMLMMTAGTYLPWVALRYPAAAGPPKHSSSRLLSL